MCEVYPAGWVDNCIVKCWTRNVSWVLLFGGTAGWAADDMPGYEGLPACVGACALMPVAADTAKSSLLAFMEQVEQEMEAVLAYRVKSLARPPPPGWHWHLNMAAAAAAHCPAAEFTGFESQFPPIWLPRDSDRIWRGSYKGKVRQLQRRGPGRAQRERGGSSAARGLRDAAAKEGQEEMLVLCSGGAAQWLRQTGSKQTKQALQCGTAGGTGHEMCNSAAALKMRAYLGETQDKDCIQVLQDWKHLGGGAWEPKSKNGVVGVSSKRGGGRGGKRKRGDRKGSEGESVVS